MVDDLARRVTQEVLEELRVEKALYPWDPAKLTYGQLVGLIARCVSKAAKEK